jgi:RHS repeat-associated protein
LAKVEIDNQTDSTIDTTIEYQYDADGNRISEAVAGTKTYHLVDANNPTGYAQIIEELDDSEILLRSYLLAHDVLSQFEAAGDLLYHLLTDGHGSTRSLVDATGQPLSAELYAYDAYGNPLGFDASQAITSLLYSGELTDAATGWQYLRARYYDSVTGTFNRLDPCAGDFSDPQSFHKYLYTHADPIIGIDPSGALLGLLAGFCLRAGIFGAITGGITGATFGGIDRYLEDRNLEDAILGAVTGGIFGAVTGFLTGGYADKIGTAWRAWDAVRRAKWLKAAAITNALATTYSVATSESLGQGVFRGATGLVGLSVNIVAIRETSLLRAIFPRVRPRC